MLATLDELIPLLRCPVTHRPIEVRTDPSRCVTSGTDMSYPIVEGVPILLRPDLTELWRRDRKASSQTDGGPPHRAIEILRTAWPSISLNVAAKGNVRRLIDELSAAAGTPSTVLIVGGATRGEGLDPLFESPEIRVIVADLAIGEDTMVVADAHTLPFNDGTFDAVICQAVLEHVAEPAVVAAEVHRVLAGRGFVYSEIPFMQQVHEGAHDVARFTLTGHRLLWRRFDELAAGACNGPGMALAWSLRYFALSFASTRVTRALISRLLALATFWLKDLDRLISRRPAAVDAAGGTYFLGRRRAEEPIDVESIFRAYDGAVNNAGLSSRS